MRNLTAMPNVRGVGVRRDPLIDRRSVNRKAVLGQSVETLKIEPQACDHCRNGVEPFVDCVVIEGMFDGSCAHCHHDSERYRCNFRDHE